MNYLTKSKEAFGTVIEITLPQSYTSYFKNCFDECERIEEKYSRFIDNNYLSKINSKLNKEQELDEETLYLVEQALQTGKETKHAFTLSTSSLLESWGYDKEYSFLEKGEGNIGKIELKGNILFIDQPIEFGGFGKGYLLDQLKEILKEVPSCYINAGGDVFAKGESPEGGPWKILIEDPLNSEHALGVVELDNKILAISSAQKRAWKDYHHLINPKTKLPAQDMLCTCILHESGIKADAYATALFVMGFEKAQKVDIDSLLISLKKELFKKNIKVDFFR